MSRSILQPVLLGLLCLTRVATAAYIPSIEHSRIFERADEIRSEYDYIIVGGGTAGLTVADRLTESGRYSVLVIELGKFENSTNVTTASLGFLGLADPSLSFNIPSVPQVNLNNRQIPVFGGVMLGGSSGINGLQVMRGQKADYDRWANYFGSGTGWTWNGLLPYFKKAFNFHPPTARFVRENFRVKTDTRFWGNRGKLHASFPNYVYPFQNKQLAAMGEFPGVTYPADSGAGDVGVFWHPSSVDPGPWLRSFSRPAHWDGIESSRPNYHTLVSQRVTKVVFQGTTAKGVQFIPASATTVTGARTVNAKKEIIISAGTIHTPKILQASGVGAKPLLQSAGIPLVVDLPGVGANFQDHPFQVGALFNFTKFPASYPEPDDLFTNATFFAEAQAQFADGFGGPLSIASGSAAGWLPFPVIAPQTYRSIADRYEAQNPAAYLPAGTHSTVVAGYQAQKKALAAMLRSTNAANYNILVRGGSIEGGVVLLHPLSRGTVAINPAEPYISPPRIDYRALSNPADIDVLFEFTKFTRKLWTESSLKQYGPVEIAPGAQATTREQVLEWLRTNMNPSTFHPVGTAAMLPRNLGGVVDQGLRVYGVKGLSVVDASVMPELPGAYTQQTTYAIAEKAADLIKARA